MLSYMLRYSQKVMGNELIVIYVYNMKKETCWRKQLTLLLLKEEKVGY